MIKILLSVIFIFIMTFNGYAADITVCQGAIKQVLSVDELRRHLKLSEVFVQDPVYQKRKHYQGYWLNDIFDLAGFHPTFQNELIFVALDGYRARITESEAIKSKAKPFVAIKDLDAPDDWENIPHGKQMVSPAPFYLVWETPVDIEASKILPWPYQMVAIKINDVPKAQEKLFPDTKNPSVVHGFAIFSQNCLACHSLNLEGGAIGPELNVPKNILEYQSRKFLRAFIKNPSSFRAKSQMPDFKDTLLKQDIEDLLDYLAWMGKHKDVDAK